MYEPPLEGCIATQFRSKRTHWTPIDSMSAKSVFKVAVLLPCHPPPRAIPKRPEGVVVEPVPPGCVEGAGEGLKRVGVAILGAAEGDPPPAPEEGAVEGVPEGEGVDPDPQGVMLGSLMPNFWKSCWSNCQSNWINCWRYPSFPA